MNKRVRQGLDILRRNKKAFEFNFKNIGAFQNKRGFEFSFAWMFALLVGAVILFLAVYVATGILQGSSYERDTEIAKELTILFDPFETGFAESKASTITLPTASRIYNDCSSRGVFGSQIISSSQQTFGKWSDPGGDIKVNNRYVFSRELEEGKKLYLFSKNFEMPFKVSEMIILSSKKYCFKNLPNHVDQELKNLNLESIEFDSCSIGSITVCPHPESCDVQIKDLCGSGVDCEEPFKYGYVLRGGKRMFYRGSLLYAAVFSDPDIYECNVKRLAKRLEQLSLLYKDQNSLTRGCGNVIDGPLHQLAGNAASLTNSDDLDTLWGDAQALEAIHERLQESCRIWVR